MNTTFELPLAAPGVPEVHSMIERGAWATRSFASYDQRSVGDVVAAAGALASAELVAAAAALDLVTPRAEGVVVHLPRPAGVVVVRVPAAAAEDAAHASMLFALAARDAVLVLSPDDRVTQRARTVAAACVDAGAPDGVVQVVDQPTPEVVETALQRADVVLGADPSACLRVLGDSVDSRPPGAVPVLVDATADPAAAAAAVARSLSRHADSGLGGTAVVVVADVAERFLGGLTGVEIVELPAALPELISAVPPTAVPVIRVPDARRGVDAARAVVRVASAARGAVVHSHDDTTVAAFAAATSASRVVVNEAVGPEAVWAGLRPDDLVRWTTVIGAPFGLTTATAAPHGPVPAYPVASNLADE